jgi:hypothetical protein
MPSFLQLDYVPIKVHIQISKLYWYLAHTYMYVPIHGKMETPQPLSILLWLLPIPISHPSTKNSLLEPCIKNWLKVKCESVWV